MSNRVESKHETRAILVGHKLLLCAVAFLIVMCSFSGCSKKVEVDKRIVGTWKNLGTNDIWVFTSSGKYSINGGTSSPFEAKDGMFITWPNTKMETYQWNYEFPGDGMYGGSQIYYLVLSKPNAPAQKIHLQRVS